MSGLKNVITEENNQDSVCLDQYEDGSVRLMCHEEFVGMDGVVCEYKRTAFVHLSRNEMDMLVGTYLQNRAVWDREQEEMIKID